MVAPDTYACVQVIAQGRYDDGADVLCLHADEATALRCNDLRAQRWDGSGNAAVYNRRWRHYTKRLDVQLVEGAGCTFRATAENQATTTQVVA